MTTKPYLSTAAGVSYASLVVSTFGVAQRQREQLMDFISLNFSKGKADKLIELIGCPFCVSFWISLVVCRGNIWKALKLAGMASVPISAAESAIALSFMAKTYEGVEIT